MIASWPPLDGGENAFIDALNSTKAVAGSTHTYYRYPARFSPEFAREAIRLFTKPGDTVFDPFMGGGTSAVEAIATGRRFIGNDINHLAYFVSRVKTTLLSRSDATELREWRDGLANIINLRRRESKDPNWEENQIALPWRVRRVVAQMLESLHRLGSVKQKQFARCSILNVAQWALDCKSRIPGTQPFLSFHHQVLDTMLGGNEELKRRINASDAPAKGRMCRLFCSDASLLHARKSMMALERPRLVLTSPPYLGVHVLYHRWQILGRRETSAPYWIVDKPDGHGGSFYTFADRKAPAYGRYMSKLRACFKSIREMIDRRTLIVQLVAFPDADIQLPVYLSALAQIGLQHCESIDTAANRVAVARDVPNRRWYARLSNQSHSSREFLLIHRLKQ